MRLLFKSPGVLRVRNIIAISATDASIAPLLERWEVKPGMYRRIRADPAKGLAITGYVGPECVVPFCQAPFNISMLNASNLHGRHRCVAACGACSLFSAAHER